MKQINIKNGKCFLRSFMIFLLTLSMIISMLSVCCNAVYSDNNSSVYTIKDHEISEYNKPARIELHFIGDMATKPEFHDSTANTYKSPLYEFDNMNQEKQTSMILADGETVEKIENPPNHGDDEFFYGWYVVNIDETTPHETVLYNGTSYDCIVYHQTDDPVLLRYGDVISVEMNDEQTAISWKINGVTVQDDLPLTDKKGCCGHVYLAPLYSDYCFINFFSEPLDNKEPSEIPDETLLTRKLIVPGADNISDVLLSDTIAPSPDSRHKVFVGWESTSESLEYRTKFDMFDSDLKPITGVFRTSDTHIPLREEDDPDGYFLRCHSPKADVNLYPLFSQARWITFDTNSNKEASYVSSVIMLTSDSADNPNGTKSAVFETSSRKGFTFNGWKIDTSKYSVEKYDLTTHSHTTLSEYMVTDSSGNVKAPEYRTTIRVCKKDDTSVIYCEIINDNNTGKLIIYDTVPTGTPQDDYTDGLSLTADWISSSQTTFSVVIWKQKATDSPDLNNNEKKYDYYDYSDGLTGTTGAGVNDISSSLAQYTQYNFKGFRYNRMEIYSRDDSSVLHADGSSIVNIYYDRNVYELNFYKTKNHSPVLVKTIRELYHHNISEYFPITENNGDRWKPENSSTFDKVLVYIDSMPDENINFQLDHASNNVLTANYYVETLDDQIFDKEYDGRKYKIYHTTNAAYSYFTYNEDFIDIDGCEKQKAFKADDYNIEFKPGNTPNYNIDCYYTRTRWKLVYNCNYDSVRGDDIHYSNRKSENRTVYDIPFEKPLADYNNFIPNSPDLYKFDGWYYDPAGIRKVDFSSEKMPAGNMTVYAKWTPVQILVKYDLDGGVFTNDDYNKGIFNYYTVTANERLVKPEVPERNYIIVSNEEAEDLKNLSIPVYRYLNYHYISFDEGRDNTNLPTEFRKAQYFEDTQANKDNLFEQYIMQHPASEQDTLREAMKNVWLTSAFYGSDEYFRAITENDDIEYVFDDWYLVDEITGEVKDDPYDFTKPVTGSITLRAKWRLKGGYKINYIPEYIDSENNYINGLSDTIQSWNDPQVNQEESSYADHAVTSIFRQPSIITKNGIVTNDYIFDGWRIVRRIQKGNGHFEYVPLFPDENYYEPGQKFTVDSVYALEGNNTIYMQAVYSPRSVTLRRPETITMNFDANGGYIIDNQNNRLSQDEIISFEKPGTAVKKYNTSATGYDQLQFQTIQTNKAIHLVNYAVDSKNYDTSGSITTNNIFRHPSDFFLLGFDDEPNDNDFIAQYAADSVITMNRKKNNSTLYAVWEPMVYLDLVNETHEDVTVSLSSEDNMKLYVINERINLFDRVKITDSQHITIPKKDTATGQDGILHIALPYGMQYSPDETITISGKNEIGSGYMMTVTSNNPNRTSGDVVSVPEIINYNSTFELNDKLFYSENPSEALTVTFSEKESEYTVILDENYEGGSIHELYCSHSQLNDPDFSLNFVDPNTRIANEFHGWAFDKNSDTADYNVHSSNYRITDLRSFFSDHHIDGNDNIVHLYAVWYPDLIANQVRIYKEVINGAADKEFTFEINFSGKYGYYYSSNQITPSGETKYKILPDEYLRLTMTEFDGKENKGTVNDNQLKKNYPLIDIMIEKFKNSDTDAVSPLLFPDGSIKKHLTWTKYIPGGTVYETGNITFTVTEVEGTEDNSPKLENYTTDITITGYSENAALIKDVTQKNVKWNNCDTAAWILFVNNRLMKNITVSKTVVDPLNINPSKEFHFTASLKDTQNERDYNYNIPENDSSFTLTAGKEHIIENVPVGAEIEISESPGTNSYETSISHSDDITNFTENDRQFRFTVTNGENRIIYKNFLRSVQLRVRNISEEGNAMTDTAFRMTGKVLVFNNAVPFADGYLKSPVSASDQYHVYYDDDYSIVQTFDESGHSRVPDIHVAVKYAGDGNDDLEVIITNPEGQSSASVSRDPNGDAHSYIITIISPIRYIAPTNHSSKSMPFVVMMIMSALPIASIVIKRRSKAAITH